MTNTPNNNPADSNEPSTEIKISKWGISALDTLAKKARLGSKGAYTACAISAVGLILLGGAGLFLYATIAFALAGGGLQIAANRMEKAERQLEEHVVEEEAQHATEHNSASTLPGPATPAFQNKAGPAVGSHVQAPANVAKNTLHR